MLFRHALALLPVAALLTASASQDELEPFELTPQDGYFVAEGTLVPETGAHIDRVRRDHPAIRVLVMEFVPGSDDDNEYLGTAWKLHRDGFTTVVPGDGLVASGGTDFFLAGRHRIIEPGACIGVHSWEDAGPPAYQATDVPRDHEDHEDFLDYFKAIGISPEFYWFTIAAAPADRMHWMSPAEINRFQMSSTPVPDSGETAAQRAARCSSRAEGD
ncbi:hypothetical protein [Erythrobacter sp. JK5]|uniref:hypothetical protein n=1 Tax=Erythrobacter sp. JK5 TaxID=2829500 RepID=UPI001BA994AB|nr:hypothetical protein [Erythrobacter sp. JK5]QUL37965.1 hypothetical protein KDC96_00565 [Erythrobacter sp. JK5]